jgi:hypothetical protein
MVKGKVFTLISSINRPALVLPSLEYMFERRFIVLHHEQAARIAKKTGIAELLCDAYATTRKTPSAP